MNAIVAPMTAGLIVVVLSTLCGCSDTATRPVAKVTATAPVAAADMPATHGATPYECKFTEDPIAIDGTLDDAAWKNAETIENFSMPWLG